MVVITPMHYNSVTKEGCFKTMLDRNETDNAIIIYNENVIDYLDWDDDTAGAGSAKIRPYAWPYNQDKQPRVVGLPTGFSSASKGFRELDRDTKEAIDSALQRLIVFCRQYHIEQIIYSADEKDEKLLGTGIFEVDNKVLIYISSMLWKIPTMVDNADLNIKSLEKIREKELLLLPRAKLEQNYALLKSQLTSRKRVMDHSSLSFQTTLQLGRGIKRW